MKSLQAIHGIAPVLFSRTILMANTQIHNMPNLAHLMKPQDYFKEK